VFLSYVQDVCHTPLISNITHNLVSETLHLSGTIVCNENHVMLQLWLSLMCCNIELLDKIMKRVGCSLSVVL